MNRHLSVTTAVGALFLIAACGGTETPPEAAAPAATPSPAEAEAPAESTDISVSATGAFIQEPPAGRDVLLAGVTLTASGGDVKVVAAESPIATRVEFHSMGMADGMMTMEQVDAIDLPDGEDVVIEGGGNHMMLFGVSDLDLDATYPLTLTVEKADGSTLVIETQADVRPLGG